MTERPHFHFSFSCIGSGNGNPLQCSCLENPRDGGACWAAVYGVAQSRTRLKRLSSSSSSSSNEAYADFLTRLGVAISHNVVGEETRVQLEKLLAYENVNQECQRAIAPIREIRNVTYYLKDCHNLGSETQTIQMLAEAMAAAFKKGDEGCFVCGDKSH